MSIFDRLFGSSSGKGKQGKDGLRQEVQAHSEAVKKIIPLLKDRIPHVQVSAAEALGEIGDPYAIGPLIANAKSDLLDASRERAVQALEKIGTEDAFIFLESLRKIPNLPSGTREEVDRILERRKHPEAAADEKPDSPNEEVVIPKEAIGNVEHLVTLLTDNSQGYSIKCRAAETLCELGDTGRAALISLLEHKDSEVRESAEMALGKGKDVNAVAPLITILDRGPYEDEFWAVTRALGQIGSLEAIQALVEASEKIKGSERSDHLKLIAIGAGLSKAKSAAVEPALAMLSSPSANVRYCAADALRGLKERRAVEPLIALILDKNGPNRFELIQNLVEIGDLRAIEPLITCLTDSDPRIRGEAARGLGTLMKGTR